MGIHSDAVHGGVKGDMRGIFDYKFKLIETFKDNLTRAVDEGRRQLEMEDLQTRGKVVCLKSKLDFIQPFKTHLQVNTGNRNVAPGKAETRRVDFKKENRQLNLEDRESYKTVKTRQKRKTPEYMEDRQNCKTKRQKLDDIDDSIQFRQNIKRCSTPVTDIADKLTGELRFSSERKRTS